MEIVILGEFDVLELWTVVFESKRHLFVSPYIVEIL